MTPEFYIKPGFYIKEVTWSTHEPALKLIREQVFIVEQQVPQEIEWDAFDATAIHLLAVDAQEKVVGCARILTKTSRCGSIGRMAVQHNCRRSGLGKALLEKAIEICRGHGFTEVTLSAQTHVIPFYEKAGFVVCSEAYMDANIWHVDMQLNI